MAERRERRSAIDDVSEVLDAAARFLEARPRSIAEVRRRLATAGYRPELVEPAVARLVELGYLDDEAFARTWVESRDRAHPRGEHVLRRELGLKGIDRAVVDAVLADRREARGPEGRADEGRGIAAVDPDRAAADQLLARRSASLLREPDVRKRRARAYALLARNGFDPEVCASAVAAWLAPHPDAAGP